MSEDATGEEKRIHVEIGHETFSKNGLIITSRNYLDVYPYEKYDDKYIGDFSKGQIIEKPFFKIQMTSGKTCPPPLLSESDLISTMDKNGIGTDATIHEHINTILERKYAVKKGERLWPTKIGLGLVKAFDKIPDASNMCKPVLRAELEDELRKVCQSLSEPKMILEKQLNQYKEIYSNYIAHKNEFLKMIRENASSGPFEIPHSPLSEDQNCDTTIDDNEKTFKKRSDLKEISRVDNPEIRCNCGLIPIVKISRSSENPDRPFYTCTKAHLRCNFFAWADSSSTSVQRTIKTTARRPKNAKSDSFIRRKRNR